MWQIEIIIGVIGIIFFAVILFRPKHFWSIIIVSAIAAEGIKALKGFTIVDEYFILSVILGGMFVILVKKNHNIQREKIKIWDYLHEQTFTLMSIYMAIEGIRGILLWQDLKISRWVVFYIMLWMLMYILSRKYFNIPDRKHFLEIVSKSILIYAVVYLAHGILSETFRGLTRWEVSGEWAGPAYAVFSFVFGLPAAILLLRDGLVVNRVISRMAIIATLAVAYYYDSRSLWVLVGLFLFLSIPLLKLKNAIPLVFVPVFFLITISFLQNTENNLKNLKDISGEVMQNISSIASYAIEGSLKSGVNRDVFPDLKRFLNLQAAFETISQNTVTWFFGYGLYSSHFVMIPTVEKFTAEYLYYTSDPTDITIVRTTGFAALLVDTGVLGMILFIANFLFIARKIIVQRIGYIKIILLAILLVTFLWSFGSNITDAILLYLIIMPSGFLVQLIPKYEKVINTGSINYK